MANSSVSVDARGSPRLFSRPTLAERKAIIGLEDRFQRPNGMDQLLIELHHRKRLPLEAIAEEWGVEASFVRYLLWCYEVQELPAAELSKPDMPVSAQYRSPFYGIGAGIIGSRILKLWQRHHSWPSVLQALRKRKRFHELTVVELCEWVNAHPPPGVNSEALIVLRKLAAASVGVSTGSILHAAGVVLSPAAVRAIEQRCRISSCSEEQLFSDQYSPASIVQAATGFHVNPVVYLQLVRHFRGSTVPADSQPFVLPETGFTPKWYRGIMTGVDLVRGMLSGMLICQPNAFAEFCGQHRYVLEQYLTDGGNGVCSIIREIEPDEFWEFLAVRVPWLLDIMPDDGRVFICPWDDVIRLFPADIRRALGYELDQSTFALSVQLFVWLFYAQVYVNFLVEASVVEAIPQKAKPARAVAQAPRNARKPHAAVHRKPYGGADEDRSLNLYLREIGETPLLGPGEEVRLCGRIKAGDQEARDHLIKANLRFVVSVAKQYQNQGLSLSDLINEGNIGLIKAAKRFDETLGWKFISYAVWWIRQAILQALAEQSRIVRIPLNRVGDLHKAGKAMIALEQQLGRSPTDAEIADALDRSEEQIATTLQIASSALSLDKPFADGDENTLLDILEDEQSPAPDGKLLDHSLRLEIEKALDTLTPREAEVLTLYFGLNREKALTLEEIGGRLSLTRERVRQIKEKALRRMRHASRSRSLRSYLDMDFSGGETE